MGVCEVEGKGVQLATWEKEVCSVTEAYERNTSGWKKLEDKTPTISIMLLLTEKTLER